MMPGAAGEDPYAPPRGEVVADQPPAEGLRYRLRGADLAHARRLDAAVRSWWRRRRRLLVAASVAALLAALAVMPLLASGPGMPALVTVLIVVAVWGFGPLLIHAPISLLWRLLRRRDTLTSERRIGIEHGVMEITGIRPRWLLPLASVRMVVEDERMLLVYRSRGAWTAIPKATPELRALCATLSDACADRRRVADRRSA